MARSDIEERSTMELGRYFNSKGEPILLSQDHSHARLVLTRRSKSRGSKNLSDRRDNTLLQTGDVEDL